jgi:hypothetical protein
LDKDAHLVGSEFLLGSLSVLVASSLGLGIRSGLFLLGSLLLTLLLALLEFGLGDHLAGDFVEVKLGDGGGGVGDGGLA